MDINYLRNVKSEFNHKSDCQVALFLSGKTPEDIKMILKKVISEIDKYGRPLQGGIFSNGTVQEVIRPFWTKEM